MSMTRRSGENTIIEDGLNPEDNTMIDIVKKFIYTGVGLAFLTKEKVEELARELAEKGKLSEQEGRDFIEELKEKSEQARVDLEKQVAEITEKVVRKMNLATRDDLARLEEEIKSLRRTPEIPGND